MDSSLETISAAPALVPDASRPHSPELALVEALRGVRQLDGLKDHEYLWLVQHGEEVFLPSGTRLFNDGDPATHMSILLSGEIQVRRRNSPQESLYIGVSGTITGLLPFSRMKTFGGTGSASEDVRALVFPKEIFPDLLAAIPSFGQRCVSILLDRVREITRLEQQSEKLTALGKLAANLAHELNNPASAAQRAASNLLEELRVYGSVSFEAGKLCLTEEQQTRYKNWHVALEATLKQRQGQMNPLAAGELEDRLSPWLGRHGIKDTWSMAPVFAEAGIIPEDLDALDDLLIPPGVQLALTHLASSMRAERMTETVLESTARIFGLIRAIQQYSHMDQAPLQDIDLAQSLESTLSMLHYRLSQVEVVRDFDPRLPEIAANGGELNQVWMALLENSLDAMNDKGTLRLLTRHVGDGVRVEIWDSGPGIPAELQSRIFEPFFTTKPTGEGQGLGLDAVLRILSRYSGTVEVQSRPGATCFQVRLPLRQAEAY